MTLVAYFGGPAHGETEHKDFDPLDAPRTLTIYRHRLRWGGETMVTQDEDCVYRLDPSIDAPGALAYVYEPPPASPPEVRHEP